MAGLRAGLVTGKLIPLLFAHAGVAFMTMGNRAPLGPTSTRIRGPALDAGVGLDILLGSPARGSPTTVLGGQVEYDRVAEDRFRPEADALETVALGVHLMVL